MTASEEAKRNKKRMVEGSTDDIIQISERKWKIPRHSTDADLIGGEEALLLCQVPCQMQQHLSCGVCNNFAKPQEKCFMHSLEGGVK